MLRSLQTYFAPSFESNASEKAIPEVATESLETALESATLASLEVEERVHDTHRLEAIGAGLESICLTLKGSLEEGLTPTEAHYLKVAVESYTKPLELEESLVLSQESFGGTHTRKEATALSLESVSDTLKAVWEAIVRAYHKVKDAIVAFLKHVFIASERLANRAEKLQDAVKEVSGSPEHASIKLGSAVTKLVLNGKVSGNPVKDFKTVEKIAEGLVTVDSRTSVIQQELARALTDLTNATNDTVDSLNTKVRSSKVFYGDSVFKHHQTGADHKTSYRTDVLPGDQRLYMVVGPFTLDGGIEATGVTPKVDADSKVSTLSTSDIKDVAKMALHIADIAASLKDSKLEQNEFFRDLSRKAPKASDELSQANAEKINHTLRDYSVQLTTIMNFKAKALRYLVRAGAAYVALAEKSLLEYKGATQALLSAESVSTEKHWNKAERDDAPASDFAVPEKQKLRIDDATHTKMAWSMLNNTKGLTAEEKARAKKRILKAAKKQGIDTSNWNTEDD